MNNNPCDCWYCWKKRVYARVRQVPASFMIWYEDFDVVEAKISSYAPGPDTMIHMVRLIGRLIAMPAYLIVKKIMRMRI